MSDEKLMTDERLAEVVADRERAKKLVNTDFPYWYDFSGVEADEVYDALIAERAGNRRLTEALEAAMDVLADIILHDEDDHWGFLQSAYADTQDPLTVDAEMLAHHVRVIRSLLATRTASTEGGAS